MSTETHSPLLDDLNEFRAAIDERVNTRDLPAALVFNTHITGLAVARSLGL